MPCSSNMLEAVSWCYVVLKQLVLFWGVSAECMQNGKQCCSYLGVAAYWS